MIKKERKEKTWLRVFIMSLYTTFVFELSRDRFVDYVYNNTTNF